MNGLTTGASRGYSSAMKRRKQLFETPSKFIYEGPEPDTVIQYFRDLDASENLGDGRGVLNNRISEHFYKCLDDIGLPLHFIRRLNMREQLVRNVEFLPIALMVRNYADGNLSKRLGLGKGTKLHRPIVELYLNDMRLADPLVTEEHIANFGWIAPQELDDILAISTRAHDIVSGMLMGAGYSLVDLRLEFGRVYESHPPRPGTGEEFRDEVRIVLCNDFSTDSMRLFDRQTSQIVDTSGYEVWREAVVSSEQANGALGASMHQDLASRLGILPSAGAVDMQGPSTIQ